MDPFGAQGNLFASWPRCGFCLAHSVVWLPTVLWNIFTFIANNLQISLTNSNWHHYDTYGNNSFSHACLQPYLFLQASLQSSLTPINRCESVIYRQPGPTDRWSFGVIQKVDQTSGSGPARSSGFTPTVTPKQPAERGARRRNQTPHSSSDSHWFTDRVEQLILRCCST